MPTKLPEQEQKPYAVSKNILYGKKMSMLQYETSSNDQIN